jgi:hypothetical protein
MAESRKCMLTLPALHRIPLASLRGVLVIVSFGSCSVPAWIRVLYVASVYQILRFCTYRRCQ